MKGVNKMLNPAELMKLMGMKNKFESAHPKFVSFIKDIASRGIETGSIIEISITRPDGTNTTANMKVQPEDVEMINEIKNFKN